MGSAQWCTSSATIPRMPPDAGVPRAKRKRAKSESKSTLYRRSRTCGWRDRPFRSSRIPTPTASSREGMTGGQSWPMLPPPPAREGGGEGGMVWVGDDPTREQRLRHTFRCSFTGPRKPRPHICKPPGRFTRGLTGHWTRTPSSQPG